MMMIPQVRNARIHAWNGLHVVSIDLAKLINDVTGAEDMFLAVKDSLHRVQNEDGDSVSPESYTSNTRR
jgi:hypothetical protein